ncbi:MAG: DeoR/GlpR family DNA-binding transcription regulator [Defluviitaleaceae bacterium]|nr:DeoR/GlpR family DNA-binding transcription regulator [Defluviitaleaceae bacterium]
MLAFERREKILKHILIDKKVRIGDLATAFSVSEETIRRDMKQLEGNGMLKRFYGGAVITGLTREIPSRDRHLAQIEEKGKIAQKAAELINNQTTIMADSGSTVFETLKEINRTKKDIIIVTNSVNVLYELRDSNIDIFSTGGNLRKESTSLVGPAASDFIGNYYADIAIFGCKGLSVEHGITESNEPESQLKMQMHKHSKKIMVLADHTKFDKVAFIKTFNFSQIDYLVTDIAPSQLWLDFLEEMNVEVVW